MRSQWGQSGPSRRRVRHIQYLERSTCRAGRNAGASLRLRRRAGVGLRKIAAGGIWRGTGARLILGPICRCRSESDAKRPPHSFPYGPGLPARSRSNTGSISGAADIASKPLSPEDAELKYRFRDIHGGERRIDALVEMEGSVALHNEKGCVIQYGGFSPKGGSTSSYGGDDFVMPKTVRMMWFSECSRVKRNVLAPPAFEGGSVLADVTVPVASRIPLDALDEARKKGAGLRLKMRVHPGGELIG